MVTLLPAPEALTSEEAAWLALNYVNENLVQEGRASLVSVQEFENFFNITTLYRGRQIPVYLTKDGRFLFLGAPMDISKPLEKEEVTVGNFLVSKDEICKEDGKPIVYFFGHSGCPHCRWEHPLLKEVVAEFEGLVSFHDNMDSARDREIFERYSTGAVPTLVLGCKYYRVGSGEPWGEEREKEFLTALLCKLTQGKPEEVCAQVQELLAEIK